MPSFHAKAKLLPVPKHVKWGDGFLPWERGAFDISPDGLPVGKFVRVDCNCPDVGGQQQYILRIDESGIDIKARTVSGAKLALQTLRQIAMQSSQDGLRHVEIMDFPDLQTRGFMLDISRCKVPTVSELALLVDRLAIMKYNRLELYTEHTYAFVGHELVWADASPMTADQYKRLDSMCRFAGIELVANINSLGHMERWLRYPQYQYLAESKAPFIDPLGNLRKFPTTLFPDEAAADFMDGLYAQFFENFTSGKVNIGGDEPWELGMGRSKSLCKCASDKYLLYIEHLKRLNNRVNARGFQAYFWADVLMQKPEYAKLIPENMTPVVWGYYLDHPYREQCAYMNSVGREFFVAPGTSTWNSFGSRWDCARENINTACGCAREFGALGSILTQWGDGGNHQPYSAMFPAIAHHAGCAWSEEPSEELVCDFLSRCVFCDDTGEFARALVAIGRCDVVDKLFCLHHKMFFADADQARKLSEEYAGRADFNALISSADFAASLAAASTPKCPDADACIDEIALAARMIMWAFNRAKGDFAVGRTPLQVELKFIAAEYARVWLMRARLGGLAESVGRIKSVAGSIFAV